MPSRGHSEDGDSGIARSGMHTFIGQSEQIQIGHNMASESLIAHASPFRGLG